MSKRVRMMAVVAMLLAALPLAALAAVYPVDLYSTNGCEIIFEMRDTDDWGQRAGDLYWHIDVVNPDSGAVVKSIDNQRFYGMAPRQNDTRVFLANYMPQYSGYKAKVHLWYKDNVDKGDLGTYTITLY